MAIDLASMLAASNARKAAAAAIKVSQDPVIEAKANIIVNRILDADPIKESIKDEAVIQARDESSSEDSKHFSVPPESESGLVLPGFTPDESQQAAIDTMVSEQYACLIGAAGSGKTSTLRYVLHKKIYGDQALGINPSYPRLLEGKQGLSIALVAFTGMAVQVVKQNMPTWLHPACKTIHSLLEFAPVEYEKPDGKKSQVFKPMRDALNKLEHDVIIIDEASMVGLELWHMLLDALRPGTCIYLIGDLNQLPPVAGQSMFAYALSEWPVMELTKIHRQKEPSANKIIEVAHSILNGKKFEFDNPNGNPDWRVIGIELEGTPSQAGVQIAAIARGLMGKRVKPSVDPTEPLIYDPYRDRVITAGNGFEESNANVSVQQASLNYVLARIIEPPSDDNPIITIDAGRSVKQFAVGHRVMATKNEPPDVVDRVTNGMVGRITDISWNTAWGGAKSRFGTKAEIDAAMEAAFGRTQEDREFALRNAIEMADSASIELDSEDAKAVAEDGGLASHTVTIEFINGAVRQFKSKAKVDSLSLAYASTCHKCQGSQFDTAIIVVHHVCKSQLSREWLYTAVTRASKRVIFLYTKHGIQLCLHNQRIFGRTLEEKIKKYQMLQSETFSGFMKKKIRLYVEEQNRSVLDFGRDEEAVED